MMRNLIAALLIVCWPLAAYGYERGDQLLWACTADHAKGPEEAFASVHCLGYVTGILDGMQFVFGVHPESTLFCPPSGGMSADQPVRIVTQWLEAHPEDLQSTARVLVALAFQNAFPCE